MTPPTTIHIVSDDNTLTYQETLNPTKKQTIYIYKYTKSETKKGLFLGLTELELTKLIKANE